MLDSAAFRIIDPTPQTIIGNTVAIRITSPGSFKSEHYNLTLMTSRSVNVNPDGSAEWDTSSFLEETMHSAAQ